MIKSRETPQCPHCGRKMKYRDRVRRHTRQTGGDKVWFEIERYKCESCNRLHRAIPAFLAPFKHYCLRLITAVLDCRILPREYEEEYNYLVENTMELWKRLFRCRRAACPVLIEHPVRRSLSRPSGAN